MHDRGALLAESAQIACSGIPHLIIDHPSRRRSRSPATETKELAGRAWVFASLVTLRQKSPHLRPLKE
jgi:hypothetical protein